MHEVWLALMELSDSCRGVKFIQGKALHHLTIFIFLWQSGHYGYDIPAAQRIPGVRVDWLIAPT